MFLEHAEQVHCAENKLTALYVPKATHVRCNLNQLTALTLESVVELQCSGNKLITLNAPNLRKIDCDVPKMENGEPFVPVKEIEIELKNRFDPDDTWSYDISSLDVEVALDLYKELLVEAGFQ